jgi:type I restriction enzyme S subunit
MSADATTAAPTGRKKIAQSKERSDAALGDPRQNTSSPEGAKEGGWPVVPLGELAADERNSITDGPFGSKLKTEHYTNAGPRVIRLKNIGDGEFVDAKAHISEGHFSTLQKHRAFCGDIVIAALGENPPRSCLVPESLGPAVVKADCIRFKAGPRVLPRFLNYILNGPTLRQQAKGIIHGVGRPRLNLSEIKALPIPVPSISEQRRIVAEIEKQFTRLEAGVAALRRVQANLKRYRAAVLKAACEGRLVPTEAELQKAEGRGQKSKKKFESGAELLARILTERRQTWQGRGQYKDPAVPVIAHLPPFPAGWAVASLEQLTSPARPICYGILMPKENVATGVLFVKVKDMKGDTIDLEGLHRTTPEIAAKYARASLRTGDLLLSIRGTYGRVAEVPKELDDGNITQDTARLDVTGLVNHRYVATCLRNPDCQNHFKRVARGVAVKGVNIGDVRPTPVPLPPLAEQTRIVAEVERRLSVVEELESVVTANLQRAARLRHSILQKAFSGGLVSSKASS